MLPGGAQGRLASETFSSFRLPHLDELCRITARLKVKAPNLGRAAVRSLNQFNDERNLRLLLDLPGELMAEALRWDRGNRRHAVQAQIAVAIEILLVAPMRPKYLVGLRADRHLDASSPSLITIPANESRSGRELGFALPRHTTEILESYLRYFHGRLTGTGTPWLFPSPIRGTWMRCGQALRSLIWTLVRIAA